MAQNQSTLPNPVLMACSMRSPDLVLAILARRMTPKVNLDELDGEDVSALGRLVYHQSGSRLDEEAIRALLAQGADPRVDVRDLDHHDWRSSTASKIPLALAAARRGAPVCAIIFEALGPKRLAELCQTHPLLHHCVENGREELARVLIGAGADVNRALPGMGRPISKCSSPSMFSLLVSSGAKLNLPDADGRTALQELGARASEHISAMAIQAAQAEARGQVASFAEGRDIPKTKAGDDIAQGLVLALFEAIEGRRTDRVRALWERLGLGRDNRRLLGARDAKGRTLLHAAVESRNFSLASRLIKRGLRVDEFDQTLRTPASILAGLCQANTERDRRGARRRVFAAKIFDAVDWSRRAPGGRSMFESMLSTPFDSFNSLPIQSLFSKALDASADWLALDGDGTCPLSRAAAASLPKRYLKNADTFLGLLHRNVGLDELLERQLSRPEFAAAAPGLLRAICGAEAAETWSGAGASGPVDALLGVIEKNLPHLRSIVDPETIDWSPRLASRAPSLHAAIETWRIEQLGIAPTRSRSPARSL